jgi:hypothetical protein
VNEYGAVFAYKVVKIIAGYDIFVPGFKEFDAFEMDLAITIDAK